MNKIKFITESWNRQGSTRVSTCPICNEIICKRNESPMVDYHQNPGVIKYYYVCLRCGCFSVLITYDCLLEDKLKNRSDKERIAVSSYLREIYENLNPLGPNGYYFVDGDIIDDLIKNALDNIPSTSEKLFKLLRTIEHIQEIPGRGIIIILNKNSMNIDELGGLSYYYYYLALSCSLNIQELMFYLDSLKKLDYLQSSGNGSNIVTSITAKGFEFLEKQRIAYRSQSEEAFVAIKFGDEYKPDSDVIEESIKKNGYKPIRADKEHHVEYTMDHNLRKIKGCRFMVAEISSRNLGVYYEVGYARGLGIPVIAVARKENENNIHFDLKQFNIIFYESGQNSDDRFKKLQEVLPDRIANICGNLNNGS